MSADVSSTTAAIDALSERARGRVIEPGDPGYDDARRVWNDRIDREPAVVVRAAGPADVIAAVDVAREFDRPLSVKGGGHHVSGSAVCDDGVAIDLSAMNAVRVDPGGETVVVEGGATWGDVDAETRPFGLATPGGQDPNIGVAGLTLGGGVGWLSRAYGLACDNLVGADVVTADGDFVRASADENPDLFWALRGGGGAFGVVTSFEFELHAIESVLAGSLVYPLEAAATVARNYRAFVDDAPRAVRPLFGIMDLPPSSPLSDAVAASRVAMVIVCYVGEPETGREVLAPLRESDPEPLVDSVRERVYHRFQRAGESEPHARTDLRSQYLETLSDEAIETIVARASDPPSPGATAFVSPRGGAETEPATDATAHPHREACHHVLVEARWDDPGDDADHVEWVRSFGEAIEGHAMGTASMNFLTADAPAERVRAAYGDNYDRLAECKAEWDPDGLFDASHTVDPPG